MIWDLPACHGPTAEMENIWQEWESPSQDSGRMSLLSDQNYGPGTYP